MNLPAPTPLPEDEDRYQILAMSSLALSGARVLKHDDTFAVFDRFGDIRRSALLGAEGLYHKGARYLSVLRLRLEGERPLLLSSTVREDNLVLAVDLMNPDLHRNGQQHAAHGTLHVLRTKFLRGATCYEQIAISNYGASALDVWVELEIGADFADVFEVRGTQRAQRGTLHPPEHAADGSMLLRYSGLDEQHRCARLRFSPAPTERENERVRFHLTLAAKQVTSLYVTIACEGGCGMPSGWSSFDGAYAHAFAEREIAQARSCRVDTSSGKFNAWLSRSTSDLRMLITETAHGPFPYAGVPWFSTPFGRDGILTALQVLWVSPDIARGVLSFLSSVQADAFDPAADAAPGKILHEMRDGEMAALREIPFGKYYGSVDSTPLFVMLAAEYYETTGDLAFAQCIWPNVERALAWLDGPGDPDRDGFIEYGRACRDGLVQQGWKDSSDSVFHADGSAAEGPIALCEVQGYAYAARLGGARLASALGFEERADELRAQARELRERFDAAFWCEELSTYALALDGHKRPCRVRTSNAGHCLYAGIALPERATKVAEQLLGPNMFSGWGIRTLATCERRYNPMSYHNGSVWPHDNAVIAAGLARYGLREHALTVLTGLFDASLMLELNRLPELFCGFTRRLGEGPTLYPVACSPQAWAAAAPFMLLRAALGLEVSGSEARVRFNHPVLPAFLEEVRLSNLRVGSNNLDLHLRRYPDNVGVNVLRREGKIEVLSVT